MGSNNFKLFKVWGLVLFLGLLALRAKGGEKLEKPPQITTDSGIVVILVPAGEFEMGFKDGAIAEKPVHKVNINAFYMDKYLVTQKEYQRLIGDNPSRWQERSKNPVEQVRWSDAARYCNARSREEGLEPSYNLETWECDFSKNGYRLPTEAEWEYACRAGTKTAYFFGDTPRMLQIYAWYKKNSGKRPRPIGRKLPNPWGFCDMLGNVWEWCNDFYKVDYYQESSEKNPKGPKTGDTKVLRGGCWDSTDAKCCSYTRYYENPAYTDACFGYDIYGFRCARTFRNKSFQ